MLGLSNHALKYIKQNQLTCWLAGVLIYFIAIGNGNIDILLRRPHCAKCLESDWWPIHYYLLLSVSIHSLGPIRRVNWLEDTIQTWSLLVATKKRSLCQKTLYNHGNLPQDIITHIISFLAQRGHKHNFWTDLPLPLQTHHISPNRSLNLHVLATYGIF